MAKYRVQCFMDGEWDDQPFSEVEADGGPRLRRPGPRHGRQKGRIAGPRLAEGQGQA